MTVSSWGIGRTVRIGRTVPIDLTVLTARMGRTRRIGQAVVVAPRLVVRLGKPRRQLPSHQGIEKYW